MQPDNYSPIGIFDSGIGGLTVVRAVMQALPNEHIIYFGDTARVPYGIKSPETIRRYALEITDYLLENHVKMILIACNTVSATARQEIIQRAAHIPVLDVITAGCSDALALPQRSKRVGVLGTLATVNAGTYEERLTESDSEITVFSKACPLLVPLAEEGWTDNHIARETLEIYLEDVRDKALNSLILGCTHYPLFKETIREVLREPETEIIDSAESIAHTAREYLETHKLLNRLKNPRFDCNVSDKPQRFLQLAERFLGRRINRIEVVELEH